MTAPATAPTAARDAASVTAWNLVSRVTGLVRVVVLGAALGATRLGDTYQVANQVSNVLFELLAAGTLSAFLVPGLVARMTRDGDGESDARSFAGAVLGRALRVLVPLVVVSMALSYPIAWLVFARNTDGSRNDQIRLAAFLLLFVLPQLLLYAWGAITTAVLHASGRFVAAAAAPIANNIVVTLGLALVWHRGVHGLRLSTTDRWLLGATALGGVVAMTLVPVVAAWRAGLTVRPRRGTTAGVGRDAAWASMVLIPAQIVALASLVVASRSGGAAASLQIAFTFFLLPHALFGHPIATVLYPRLARVAAGRERHTLGSLAGRGFELMGVVLLPAAALTVAAAPWLVRVVSAGELETSNGVRLISTALGWYAAGLPAYAWSLLLTRVAYADGDLRMPAYAAIAGAVAAICVLVYAAKLDEALLTVAAVAAAHTAMVWVTAGAMFVANRRAGRLAPRPSRLTALAGAAVIAGVATRLVTVALPDNGSRLAAVFLVVAAALVGVMTFAASAGAFGVRSLPRLELDDA